MDDFDDEIDQIIEELTEKLFGKLKERLTKYENESDKKVRAKYIKQINNLSKIIANLP